MKKGRILVVDDNKNVLSALRILLMPHFEAVETISSPNIIPTSIREFRPHLILLDMNFKAGINTGNEGLYWLSEIKKTDPSISVVLFTAYADIELAVSALKKGATDFIVKPWDNSKLLATLSTACELGTSRKEVKRLREKEDVLRGELNHSRDIFIGNSSSSKNMWKLVEKVASTDANILITGENGTGKSLVARRIHTLSGRAEQVIINVDMGSISGTLFESELFGHVRGAFTDAKKDRAGKFEAADGGTLFLDEIGNLEYGLQSKLLAAIQSRQIVRVGSNEPIDIDIRLISATNTDLRKKVAEGHFREDLLYRLNTIEIEVPPLRRMREDIIPLALYFTGIFSVKYGKHIDGISERARNKITDYNWPGNIRELQHTVEKAVILTDNETLTEDDFYFNTPVERQHIMDSVSLEEMERMLIERTVSQCNGNMSSASAQLGITRPTLYSKMKKYGIN